MNAVLTLSTETTWEIVATVPGSDRSASKDSERRSERYGNGDMYRDDWDVSITIINIAILIPIYTCVSRKHMIIISYDFVRMRTRCARMDNLHSTRVSCVLWSRQKRWQTVRLGGSWQLWSNKSWDSFLGLSSRGTIRGSHCLVYIEPLPFPLRLPSTNQTALSRVEY